MSLGAYTPTFVIEKGGQNITNNFQDRAISIEVQLCAGEGMQDTCTIAIDDRDWLVAMPHVGDALQVYMGYEEVGLAFLGTFEVDEVTFSFLPKAISIHGNAIGFRGPIKSKAIKNYENKTLGEIINSIAGDLSMSATVDPDLASQKVPYLNATSSPMHVLMNFEKLYGGILKIEDGKISFGKRDGNENAGGTEMPVVQLGPSHIANCQVRHINRGEYTETKAKWRDPDTNEIKTESAQSGVSDKIVLDDNGAEAKTPSTIFGLFRDQATAKAAARAQQNALDRTLGEGLFQLVMGDPWLRDQQKIIIAGFRDGIDGSYIVDIASHSFTKDGGLRTSLSTRAPSGGSETSFPTPYASEVIQPGPGQVTGELLPKQADPGNSDPTRLPGNTEVGGQRAR